MKKGLGNWLILGGLILAGGGVAYYFYYKTIKINIGRQY
jgi:hypothetical protein